MLTDPSAQKSMTWREVARAAGVSPTTASLALNDHPRVAIKTRQRVAAAAARLGFVNNHAARRLARSRSASRSMRFDQIGLIYLTGQQHGIDNACLSMLQGCEAEISEHNA